MTTSLFSLILLCYVGHRTVRPRSRYGGEESNEKILYIIKHYSCYDIQNTRTQGGRGEWFSKSTVSGSININTQKDIVTLSKKNIFRLLRFLYHSVGIFISEY